MLPATHSRLHKFLLFSYIGYRLRREFHSVRLSGEHHLLENAENYPVVLFSNHQTWWDGFLEIPLMIRYSLDYYLMMEEANLERFRFFQKCGIFGIDLKTEAGRASGLLYAVRKLKEPNVRHRTLFIYPQGRLTLPGEELLPFMPGLSTIFRLAKNARAIPVYKLIHHGRHPKAEIFIEIGQPFEPGDPATTETAALEAALARTRERLLRRIREDDFKGAHWLKHPPKNYRGKTD